MRCLTSPEVASAEWFDNPYYFSKGQEPSRVPRFRPGNAEAKKGTSVMHVQQGKSPIPKEFQNYLSDQVQLDLDQLSNSLPLELRSLLAMFIMRRGPQATIRAIRHDQQLHPETETSILNPTNYNHTMARATGIVCERMIHLFLSQQIPEEDELLSDLGSTARLQLI